MTKLVVYAICKDEIENVDAWYDSMKEADEIVVLDTGSTDGTPERLEALGATVYRDYPGPFRFDTARNASLAHVREDAGICFSVDLDEWFHLRGWAEAFKKAWESVPGCNSLNYRFVMNQAEKDGELIDDSVFEKDNCHSRRGFHWEYPVHNLLVPDEGTRKIAARVPVEFSLYHHQKYKPDRADRINLHILNVEERPGAPRPLYYLGREYFYRREWVKAIDTFDRYLEAVGENCWHDEKGNALYYQAKCWEAVGKETNAELAALRAVAETAGREPFLFLVKLYYRQKKWFAAKHYALRALQIPDNKAYFRDTATFGPVFHDYLAMIYHHLGDRSRAADEAKVCLKIEPGNPRYQKNAAYFGVSEPGAPAGTSSRRSFGEPFAPAGRSERPCDEPGENSAAGKEDTSPQIKLLSKRKTIGIAVAANGIDRETVAAFMENRQFLSPGDEIYVNDKPTLGVYNPARQKNIAIAEAIKAGHDIVVQTDIDMLLSRELIEQTRDQTADGVHFFKKSHEEDGRFRPCTYGSWNGLTARDWLKTGGLDERMFGYGYEDTHFFIRNRENGFRMLESREFEPVHRRHRTDRLWLHVDREQYARNRKLGDIPRQVNYLEARINNDYPAGHLDRVSFYTNSACPRHCPECSRQEVRKEFAGYEATMDEVRFFLDCTRFQGITYDWLILAGGETLLWPNLIDALKLFRESPYFSKIMVFTAAISERVYREIEPLADQVVFSFYGETPGYIPPNMVISDITKDHWRMRTENKPEFLPADCWCKGVYVMKGRVYSCSQYCEYALRAGADLKDEYYSEPLTSNYQDVCLGKDVYHGRFCSTCISNGKAHDWLGTVDNTQQKVYRIQ